MTNPEPHLDPQLLGHAPVLVSDLGASPEAVHGTTPKLFLSLGHDRPCSGNPDHADVLMRYCGRASSRASCYSTYDNRRGVGTAAKVRRKTTGRRLIGEEELPNCFTSSSERNNKTLASRGG
ncbi:hypothetical protein HPB52_016896 [Rhipicephalus sanguineus]|uniref:Uncharacterized protein n=1 Tax=Rhipicephalus sanguineus TaxID=34632 RepID=A0A9D4QCM9_RHISA|nr:hypothetical protein HPB52_016896 [Rhipicephalus sanguineus]